MWDNAYFLIISCTTLKIKIKLREKIHFPRYGFASDFHCDFIHDFFSCIYHYFCPFYHLLLFSCIYLQFTKMQVIYSENWTDAIRLSCPANVYILIDRINSEFYNSTSFFSYKYNCYNNSKYWLFSSSTSSWKHNCKLEACQ